MRTEAEDEAEVEDEAEAEARPKVLPLRRARVEDVERAEVQKDEVEKDLLVGDVELFKVPSRDYLRVGTGLEVGVTGNKMAFTFASGDLLFRRFICLRLLISAVEQQTTSIHNLLPVELAERVPDYVVNCLNRGSKFVPDRRQASIASLFDGYRKFSRQLRLASYVSYNNGTRPSRCTLGSRSTPPKMEVVSRQLRPTEIDTRELSPETYGSQCHGSV